MTMPTAPTKYPLPWRKQTMTVRPVPFTVIAQNGKTVCDVYREEAADYIVDAANRMAEMVPEIDYERG